MEGDHRHLHLLRPVVYIVVTSHCVGCFVGSLVVLVFSSPHICRVACLAMEECNVGHSNLALALSAPSNLLEVWHCVRSPLLAGHALYLLVAARLFTVSWPALELASRASISLHFLASSPPGVYGQKITVE